MIHQVLSVVVSELNAYLKRAVADPEDRIILSQLVDQSGGLAFSGSNHVICTLTAIEQDRSNINQKMPRAILKNPPLYINLYVLFSAHFPGNYGEALKFVSLIIAYFQGKQVFTLQNTPGLPEGVDKLSIEFNNLNQHEQNQLWSAIGAKLMPSISMKVRMLAITRDQILAETPIITGINTSVQTEPEQ